MLTIPLSEAMNVQPVKRETADHLELTLRMYVDEVRLHLDKRACLKCDICSLVCPREAVTIIAGEEDLDITIDPRVCVMCEVCAHFCPVGAVTLSYNGVPKAVFAEQRGLAPFLPKILMEKDKCVLPCPPLPEEEPHWCRQQLKLVAGAAEGCPKQCRKCLEACPREAIILDATAQTIPEPDLCLRCSQCLTVCEYEAIRVNPQFRGVVAIDAVKCPPECVKCINLCPVKAIVREGSRVYVKLETCSYCGVCRNICDYEAIAFTREEVVAEPGEFSLAWEHAVAKLLEG